jgi:Capsule assembly protein Wzi
MVAILAAARAARASAYVVYLPLDSPVYDELATLNGLGLLDDYLAEIKPISRVEAARLTIEAARNIRESESSQPLARRLIAALKLELGDEIGWIENDSEDRAPVTVHPIGRLEGQYIYSSGTRRKFNVKNRFGEELSGEEATPLAPNNDDLPTAAGSNEAVRLGGWAGAGSFLTAYGEGAMAGPLTHDPASGTGGSTSRFRLLRGELVTSAGDAALSWGLEEMAWGTGYFSSLSQGANAEPFPALRLQSIHPFHLPYFLRYLGPARAQLFFGQLGHDRYYSRPWIAGQVIVVKPLPAFEFGLTHAIDFGGRFNDHYGFPGFLGRATGLDTGNAGDGNTNSRAGIFVKFYFPSLRNTILYQEVLGEDNLTDEAGPVGRMIPFAGVSYQGGIYLPRLTADGLTWVRFEYTILSQRYGLHSDSLYWTYEGRLMGDPMGPDATHYDLMLGRWIDYRYNADLDLFCATRDPLLHRPGLPLDEERSAGVAFDVYQLPMELSHVGSIVDEIRARTAFEYVSNINYTTANSFRVAIVLSAAVLPTGLQWNRR